MLGKAETDATAWARTRADRSLSGTVDLIGVAQELGAQVVKRRIQSSGAPQGLLERAESGHWRVVVPVRDMSRAELRWRDRFTIAHELAHILLYERGVPAPANKREYWDLEDACNRVSGALLVPSRVVPSSRLTTPAGALRHIGRIQRECKVSFDVASTEAFRSENNIVGAATIRLEDDERSYLSFSIGVFPARGSRLRDSTLAKWARIARDGKGSLVDGELSVAGEIVRVCLRGRHGPPKSKYVKTVALADSNPAESQESPRSAMPVGALETENASRAQDQLTLFP